MTGSPYRMVWGGRLTKAKPRGYGETSHDDTFFPWIGFMYSDMPKDKEV